MIFQPQHEKFTPPQASPEGWLFDIRGVTTREKDQVALTHGVLRIDHYHCTEHCYRVMLDSSHKTHAQAVQTWWLCREQCVGFQDYIGRYEIRVQASAFWDWLTAEVPTDWLESDD